MADTKINSETAAAIVAETMKTRASLADLDHSIQGEIDKIMLEAAKAGRPLSEDDKTKRKKLRGEQAAVQQAFAELAFATLPRIDTSSDVALLKGKLDTINADLMDDLDELKAIARVASVAAKVSSGLAKLAGTVTGALA